MKRGGRGRSRRPSLKLRIGAIKRIALLGSQQEGTLTSSLCQRTLLKPLWTMLAEGTIPSSPIALGRSQECAMHSSIVPLSQRVPRITSPLASWSPGRWAGLASTTHLFAAGNPVHTDVVAGQRCGWQASS